MIDTSELVNNLVDLLRDIPELQIEFGGDPERIFAYHDSYPTKVSLAHAIHTMPVPAIMAVWQSTAPGAFGGVDVWKHQVTLFVRAPAQAEGEQPGAYARIFRWITKGVPTGVDVPLNLVEVHPGCYPTDLPSIQRQTDAEGLDYFEIPLTFTEIGDQ